MNPVNGQTTYSICMCNYNMADTLEIALKSILEQIDERFEVVLLDDGSSDNSVAVVQQLQKEYTNLRLIPLQRDSERKLGFSRNESIRHARGEYVLLHLDCDDITAPFIKDFVSVFHQIESAYGRDILLSGDPIQMGKRDFLLQYGPYRNIHRGEDRDMWSRLAAQNAYIPLRHHTLKTRLPKTRLERFYRAICYTFDHIRNDFRGDTTLTQFLAYELRYKDRFSLKMRLVRLLLAVPAWICAKIEGPLPQEKVIENAEALSAYRREHGGTFAQIMQRHQAQPDWSAFGNDARTMFQL